MMEVSDIDTRVIKIPDNFEIEGRSHLRTYAGFVLLKTVNPEGRFQAIDLCVGKGDRYYFRRLLTNLVSLGWARENGEFFELVRYQEVWERLGVKRCWIKRLGKLRFRYVKKYADQLPNTRPKAIKEIIKTIEQHVCERKLNQIRYKRRLSIPKGKTLNGNQEPAFLSCESVSKLLGYRSPNSGYQKRAGYFPMKRVVTSKLIGFTPKGHKFVRNSCGQLDI
jgi:hypothetical protein